MLRKVLNVFLASALCAAALASGPASAQEIGDTSTPEGFVREVYRPYERRGAPKDFATRDGVSILSPRFRALVLKDRAQAGGEIGIIDGDPICQCQDVVKFRVTEVNVGGDSKNALVDVAFRNGSDRGKVKLSLLYTDYGWLIDDITTRDMPSYRTILKSQLR
jgi:hypothetical protein